LITSPFLLFWGPYTYEVVERPDGRKLVARMQVYFAFVLLAWTLAISMIGHPLVRAMTPEQYWRAAYLVPIIGLAYLLLGLSYFFRLAFNYMKQTKYLGYAVGGCALLNLPLNFILIPRFQAAGAAWATLLSFAVLTLILFLTSQRVYAIPYEYARLTKLLGAGVIVFSVSQFFPVTSLVPAIVVNSAYLATLPLVLYGLRFFDEDELEYMRSHTWALARRVRLVSSSS